jgi:hypothetical protein
MATLANIFGKLGGAPEPVAATAPALSGGARIRPFANEDIYFFVKHIDNGSVIRAVDPAAERASWRMIATAAAAAVFLIAVLIPKAYGVLDGYKIQALRAEQQRLMGERAAIELEEARLMSPERWALMAKEQKFVDPSGDSVVYLPDGTDSAVATVAEPAR